MPMLSSRQKEILAYIQECLNKYDFSPTIEEIREKFNLSAPSTVHEHITALVNKGFLERDENTVRGLSLPEKIKTYIKIPLIGTITAGEPIEAVENFGESVKVAMEPILRGTLYALKVRGNSMIKEGIFDGDIVIAKKQSSADNGDTVVAIIDDNEATLKKIFREDGRIRLQPANPQYKPFYRKEVEIRGVVVKIIRNLK